MAVWLSQTTATRGWGFVAKVLKNSASELRAEIMLSDVISEMKLRKSGNILVKFLRGRLRSCWASRSGAEQLSYIGRALPEGSELTL
jgi:hypothetical protein